MKVKRFRIFQPYVRTGSRGPADRHDYDCVESWLNPGEYIAHIHAGYYLLLVHISKDYDDIFHYTIDINTRIRDWPYGEQYGKVYMGYGIFLLGSDPRTF